ncbi:MAG TPA: efflux RND transporter periplasmic adaptor subunit [Anaerolineales bacterium]|nr:efflux RND transporter periplasmic adaptor subunit [Anaerolineales bacterium]
MKRSISAVIIIVILIASAFVLWQYREQQQQSELLQTYDTEPARIGSLIATVGATGIVRSNQTATLVWQTTGTVEEVKVSVGDQVVEGQELANLALTSLPQNVILAQAELVSAQKLLDDLLNAELPQAEALQAVQIAQDALNNLYATYPLQLAQAEIALLDAQDALDAAERQQTYASQDRATQSQIDEVEAAYQQAQRDFIKAQKAFNKYSDHPVSDPDRVAALVNLIAAQRARDAALQTLNWFAGQPTEREITRADSTLNLAQAQLDEAQRNWNDLLEGPDPVMIAYLEAQLADAQREYEEIKNGPDPEDIAAAEARVAAAQATLDLARLTAPFSATVTDIQIKEGDQVIPNQIAFQLDALSALLIDVEVSEIDINRLEVGQPVVLIFDAILGKEYEGVIQDVGLVGNLTQGAVKFDLVVRISNPDEDVKPGMTAAVNVVVHQLDEVLLVPNQAVRLREGQQVVYILKNDNLVPANIALGASSDIYSEVLDGDLKVGDLIVLNPPSETSIFTAP